MRVRPVCPLRVAPIAGYRRAADPCELPSDRSYRSTGRQLGLRPPGSADGRGETSELHAATERKFGYDVLDSYLTCGRTRSDESDGGE